MGEDAHPPTPATSASCDSVADPPSYSPSQTQFGPVHKGVGTATQTGNVTDTFSITQTSAQTNDTRDGQTNVVQGDCNTPGNCRHRRPDDDG